MRFPLFVFSQRFPKTSHGMRREVYYERRKYDKEDYNDDSAGYHRIFKNAMVTSVAIAIGNAVLKIYLKCSRICNDHSLQTMVIARSCKSDWCQNAE